ncbi:MAG: purine-binding chemotaxis protein CheW [Pirellulales bacterium]|nr:purine-binding chemotaxis protein CheW [Pirellulales bacterium]
MTLTREASAAVAIADGLEFATFYVGDLLIGVNILQVEEINRHVTLTPVPHAPECVRGVINLRGEVVTVMDLRTILGLPRGEVTATTRNVVVNSRGEQIGLLVDRIADVVKAQGDNIEAPPANVGGVQGRFFKGVVKLDTELMVILDVDAALTSDAAAH